MNKAITRVRLAANVICYVCGGWIKEGTTAYAILRPSGYEHKHLPTCEANK